MLFDDHRRQELPLSAEELRRQPAREPTAPIPDELKEASFDSRPRKREIRRIERERPAERSTQKNYSSSEGFYPPWVRSSFKPQRRRLPAPTTILHRGERLNPAIIWGGDDRATYNDTSYPWGCVCKITNAAGGRGSGVLIGPRHILTASHCVDWTTDQAEKIEVHLAGNVASATVFDTIAYAFTQINVSPTVTTLDEDYAVLVVNERLGDSFGWLGSRTYDSDWDDDNVWTTIGYPGDIADGNQPTFQINKNLDEDEWDYGSARAMTTSADVSPGQSGSPVFGFWANDPIPYVVAVVSSYGQVWLSGQENWCSGGSDLTRLVRQARDENP